MLGLGTRLFISSETSYGVERPDRYTEQGDTASGDYKDMYTYYILNDRITTSFNQSSVDYISDHRGKRNIFHKNVNNISGDFTFNLQNNMLKFFSNILGTNQSLWFSHSSDNYKNLLSFRTQKITTVTKNFLDTNSIVLPAENYWNRPNEDPDVNVIVKSEVPFENEIKSMTLITASGDYNTDKFYRFYGVCVNSLTFSIANDNPAMFTINFLGQREELSTYTPVVQGFDFIDEYADIYPSWQAELKLNNETIPYSDFNLEINNNLEFAPFIENTNQYPTKPPFPSLREVTGSFTIEYKDETYYNYITNLSGVELKLSLINNGQEFTITCPNVVFTDGGSLDSLPEGMLELNLNFTATNISNPIEGTHVYDYTSYTEGHNPSYWVNNTSWEDEISFSIKER